MTAPRLAALALSLLAAGCSPRRIPGTEIPATDDTTAIAAVIEKYQAASGARDAAAVLALVSPLYFDDAGTPDPADDLDFERLSRVLPADLARVSGVRMSLKLNDIQVDGDRAQAYVSYDARYRVTTKGGEVAKAQQDVSRLLLAREKGTWKIVAGL